MIILFNAWAVSPAWSLAARQAAAALLAVSPGMIFISRYFIHEMMVLFFTLGIVAAMEAYGEKKTAAPLYLASASMGFLFATKETAAPTVLVMLIAWAMGRWWVNRFRRGQPPAAQSGRSRKKARAGARCGRSGLTACIRGRRSCCGRGLPPGLRERDLAPCASLLRKGNGGS